MPDRPASNPTRETPQRARVTDRRGGTGGDLFLRGSSTGGLYALERTSGGAGVGSPMYLGPGSRLRPDRLTCWPSEVAPRTKMV
jgi:hypothetical protein